MLEQFFTNQDDLDHLRSGALGNVLDDLATCLKDQGYAPAVVRSYLSIAGHFSHWLGQEGIGANEIQEDTATRFCSEHLPMCRCIGLRGMRGHVRAALGHVLAALKC